MVQPWHIYREAEEQGIQVHFLRFEELSAVSVPGHIGIDPAKFPTTAEEATAAAHELGHGCTGAFYAAGDSDEERRRCENMAERYAILHYLPREALLRAMRGGLTEPWQLAEHFGFTEAFIRRAVRFHFGGDPAEAPPARE